MSVAASILIVEDDDIQAAILSEAVRTAGFSVLRLARAEGAIAMVLKQKPHAVLLDLGLPDQHGFELCRALRRVSRVPIMMITAQSEPLDQVLGLELGADDYIVKPFDLNQVLARLKALLRRAGGHWQAAAGIQFQDETLRASWKGAGLPLTRIEYQLLKRLAHRPGHILSRNQLLDAIYDQEHSINDRTIDSHIRNLRKKLQAVNVSADEPDPIEAVYGMGYRFVLSE